VIVSQVRLECDFGTDFWVQAVGVLKQIDDEFGKKAKGAFGGVWPVAAPVFDMVSVGIQTAAALPRFLGNAGTRPIGMTPAPEDSSKYVYRPKMLALDAKTAAEIAAMNYLPGKPGVFSVPYQDVGLGDGRYELFIQVEDISGASPAWSHVGHANWVRAMAMWGPSLLAITDDAKMWSRSLVEANVNWAPAGAAPLPAGLAVSNNQVYCAGQDNGLYAKADPFVAPWQRIGHANQVVSMTAMGGDPVCATTDNQIWRRPATAADVNWTVIGNAPAPVGGLAYQQNDNSLWAATRDNRLWKFHP
jgi:hypothetical protein